MSYYEMSFMKVQRQFEISDVEKYIYEYMYETLDGNQ